MAGMPIAATNNFFHLFPRLKVKLISLISLSPSIARNSGRDCFGTISLGRKFSRPIEPDPARFQEAAVPSAVTDAYGRGSIELISYHDSRGPGGDRKD